MPDRFFMLPTSGEKVLDEKWPLLRARPEKPIASKESDKASPRKLVET
jgi:hypothetical protein